MRLKRLGMEALAAVFIGTAFYLLPSELHDIHGLAVGVLFALSGIVIWNADEV